MQGSHCPKLCWFLDMIDFQLQLQHGVQSIFFFFLTIHASFIQKPYPLWDSRRKKKSSEKPKHKDLHPTSQVNNWTWDDQAAPGPAHSSPPQLRPLVDCTRGHVHPQAHFPYQSGWKETMGVFAAPVRDLHPEPTH